MIKYYEGDGRLSLVTEHNGVLYLTEEQVMEKISRSRHKVF